MDMAPSPFRVLRWPQKTGEFLFPLLVQNCVEGIGTLFSLIETVLLFFLIIFFLSLKKNWFYAKKHITGTHL